MWPEGYEAGDDDDLIDDVSNRFVLCALHQAKIIRERWKFWSGSVPANVSVRLHRLESLLSIKNEGEQQRSRSEIVHADKQSMKASSNNCRIGTANVECSQPFMAEMRTDLSMEKYLREQTKPKDQVVIQGPDLPRSVSAKRRVRFWCCS